MIGVLLLIFVTALLINFWKKHLKKYEIIDKFPGPSLWELLLFFIRTKNTEEIYSYTKKLNTRFGSVVKMWIKPTRPKLMIADHKYVEKILASHQYISKSSMYDIMTPLLEDSIGITLDDDKWRKHRKALNQAFSIKILEKYSYLSRHHIEIFFDKIKKYENKPLDTQFVLNRYTLDVMIEALTSERSNFQNGEDSKYLLERDIFFQIFLEKAYSPLKANDFLFKFSKKNKAWIESCEYLKEFSRKIVIKRLTEHSKSNQQQYEQKVEFLDYLLSIDMPVENMVNELSTFIIGAHDTTSQTLCFTLYEIAKRPEVQLKILEEYIGIVGKDKIVDVTFAETQQMKYIECVLKETLRMYPSAPFIQRSLTTPVKIDEEVELPAGVDLIFSIISIHYSEKYYDSPLEYNPDRFLTDEIKENFFLPFSLGPRNCIGYKLAMVQMKIILGHIIRNFEIHPVQPEHQMNVVGEWILRSLNGVPIIMKDRIVT